MDPLSSSEPLIDILLEDYWFFENLFTKRSSVLRYCHSDPFPSSSSSSSSSSSLTSSKNMGDSYPRKAQEASIVRSDKIRFQEPKQVVSSVQKKESMAISKLGSHSAPRKIREACLIRTPSLPHRMDKREVSYETQKMINMLTRHYYEKNKVLESTKTYGSCSSSSSSNNDKISLQRTQTMPSNIRRNGDNEEDEFEDQGTDLRMGFLIREAIASSQNVPKVLMDKRQRPLRSLKSEEVTVMVKQGSSSPKTLRKTLSSIETTKDMQGNNDQLMEPRVRTGLMATPPRAPKDSMKEVKDQIKFWARAVGNNIRQEC